MQPTVLEVLYKCAKEGWIKIPGKTKETITKNYIRRLIEQGAVKVKEE
jgi:acyl-CoA-binding protein